MPHRRRAGADQRREQPHRQIGPRHRDDLRGVGDAERTRRRRLQRRDFRRFWQAIEPHERLDRPAPRRNPGRQVDPVRAAERRARLRHPPAMGAEGGPGMRGGRARDDHQ
jgi:hypothetical protein